MLLFTQIHDLRAYLHSQKANLGSIGFVPTMGALHQGHLSLISQSKAQCDITVCSIFVNPTQFNNTGDLEKYPRTIASDIRQLASIGCDVLFHPNPQEMYPNGAVAEEYQWGALTDSLEGAFRPGHFNGVITVVKRLFEIVEPQMAFFGKKDFQQCAVIKRLINEFKFPIKLVLAETERELDGMAMSSRNTRLSESERQAAQQISQTLFWIKQNQNAYAVNELLAIATEKLQANSFFKLEYLSIVEDNSLTPVTTFTNDKHYVVLIALWCGNVRLIDNIELS